MFKGLKFLLKYCWSFDKWYIICIISSQFISAVSPLLFIIIPKFILDELMNQKRSIVLFLYILILVGTNIIISILANLLNGQAFLHKSKAFVQFQIFLSEKMALADYDQLENPDFLDKREKANKFIFADGQGFAEVIDQAANIIGKVFVFLGVITIISTLNILIVIIFVVLVLLSTYIDSKAKKANVKLNLEKAPYERRGNYFSNLLSDYSYGKEIRLWNIKDWLINKYEAQLEENQMFYRKSVKNNCRSFNYNALISFVQQAIVYVFLCYQVISDNIGIGSFTMYLNAANTFSNAMKDVLGSIVNIRQYSIYYEALVEYMNVKQEIRTGNKDIIDPTDNYKIEFCNVSFKYPGQSWYSVRNINLTIKSGEKLSIVGENGAGKTTFIKLLMRLYDPSDGVILLNGKDIKDIDYDQYLSLFSAVFQDFKLISLSTKENVTLKDSDIEKDEVVKEILIKAGLPQKYIEDVNLYIHKDFGENGIEPSGGEGQKLALARALYRTFYKKSEFIILDEPTAALDPRAEYEIYQQFNNIVNGKTAVFISHRLSSSRFCDKIAVFQHGEIIEYGNHRELIKKDGIYKELYSMQSQYYNDNHNYM